MRDGVTTFLNILSVIIVIGGFIAIVSLLDNVNGDFGIIYAISDAILTLLLVVVIQMYNNIRLIRLQQAETHNKMYYMQQMLYNIYQNTLNKQMPQRNNMQPQRNIPPQNNVGANNQTGTLNQLPRSNSQMPR